MLCSGEIMNLFKTFFAVGLDYWYISLFAFAISAFAMYAFRLIPQKWLCDYNETPSEIHTAKNRKMPAIKIIAFGFLNVIFTIFVLLDIRFLSEKWIIGTLLYSVISAILMLTAVCDSKYLIIPDELLILTGILSIILWITGAMWGGYANKFSPFIGGIIGLLGFWLVLFIMSKILKKEAMGFGDVKLILVLGLIAGTGTLCAALFIAVFSAAIILGIKMLLKKHNKENPFPFGPYLIYGTLCAVSFKVFWQFALALYLRLFI